MSFVNDTAFVSDSPHVGGENISARTCCLLPGKNDIWGE